jgi:hypothetical protein
MTDTSLQNEMGTFTDLLKAFAAAIKPHLGLSDEDGLNPNDIEDLVTQAIEEIDLHDAVNDALSRVIDNDSDVFENAFERFISDNDSIVNMDMVRDHVSEELSYNADDYGIMTQDSFDSGDYDLVTNYELDDIVSRNMEGWVADAISHVVDREFILNLISGDDFDIVRRIEEAA